MVDDRLPTQGGSLMSLKSSKQNEFWSALLEKAYAKLYGSYEALDGGKASDALADFTGGIIEKYMMANAPKDLFRIMEKAIERHSMMGTSATYDANYAQAAVDQGLVQGHAYSVTGVKTVVLPRSGEKVQLVRIRNPWGNDREWKGAWSDKSAEWNSIPEETKKEIGLSFENDGEFFVCFSDFLKYFHEVEICNLSPDSLTEERPGGVRKDWNMNIFKGEWVSGVSSGGCRNPGNNFFHTNPQYLIKVEDPDEDDDEGMCTVVVALMQKNRRANRNLPNVAIGFVIYQVVEKDRANKPQQMRFFETHNMAANGPSFINSREVSYRFKLAPGHYLLVPSTFDENEEAEFMIRVFTETAHTIEEHDKEIGFGSIEKKVSSDVRERSHIMSRSYDYGKVFFKRILFFSRFC